jgi:hypothetical protein
VRVLRRTAVLAILALVLTGCAGTAVPTPAEPAAPPSATGSPSPTSSPTPTGAPDADGRLIGRGTVIDEGAGPRLCFMVLQSLPPQCGTGVELAEWRWPEDGVERASGTMWGDFAVVGTYDGKRFRVEKTVEPAFPDPTGEKDVDFSSPCPEPAGGWRAPDPARATQDTQDKALRLGARLPGYGDAWIDDLGDTTQDPARIVLNLSVTEDLSGAERALRRVWGGALCVSRAERSYAELAKISREVLETRRSLGGGFGFGHVDMMVVHDDGTLQRKLDRRYGKGLVRVGSALRPYPG